MAAKGGKKEKTQSLPKRKPRVEIVAINNKKAKAGKTKREPPLLPPKIIKTGHVFKCPQSGCIFETGYKWNMQRHKKEKHTQLVDRFMCKACNVWCMSRGNYKKHLESKLAKGDSKHKANDKPMKKQFRLPM